MSLKNETKILNRPRKLHKHNFEARENTAWSRSEWTPWPETWWRGWLPQNGIRSKKMGMEFAAKKRKRNPRICSSTWSWHGELWKEKWTPYHLCQWKDNIKSELLGKYQRNIPNCEVIYGKSCLTQHRALLPTTASQSSNQQKSQVVETERRTKSRPRTDAIH